MFLVTLICDGLPAPVGETAARDITKEFANHRQWHKRVACEWDGVRLVLRAENDFDKDGRATLDEFGGCIVAYIPQPSHYEIRIESVSRV